MSSKPKVGYCACKKWTPSVNYSNAVKRTLFICSLKLLHLYSCERYLECSVKRSTTRFVGKPKLNPFINIASKSFYCFIFLIYVFFL